ncbi:hypothetical protein [Roseomonas mucosa]|nr:hypothetical protein [Roseomonas mucosa]
MDVHGLSTIATPFSALPLQQAGHLRRSPKATQKQNRLSDRRPGTEIVIRKMLPVSFPTAPLVKIERYFESFIAVKDGELKTSKSETVTTTVSTSSREDFVADINEIGKGDFSVERITTQLSRLQANWAGEGTRSPSEEIIKDISYFSYLLPASAQHPEVNIDVEDGFVTLSWTSKKNGTSFNLIFVGGGKVIGTHASIFGSKYQPWSFLVTQEIRIAEKMEDDVVLKLLKNA